MNNYSIKNAPRLSTEASNPCDTRNRSETLLECYEGYDTINTSRFDNSSESEFCPNRIQLFMFNKHQGPKTRIKQIFVETRRCEFCLQESLLHFSGSNVAILHQPRGNFENQFYFFSVCWSVCDCSICNFFNINTLFVFDCCAVSFCASQDANSHTDELGIIPIDRHCSVDAIKDDGGTMHCFELTTPAGKRVCCTGFIYSF